MITATTGGAELPPYQTLYSNGKEQGVADVSASKGGTGAGFRPHELLEAALATCVAMTVKMYADHHGIPLRGVTARVTLDRTSNPQEAAFIYSVELGDPGGELTEDQRARLLRAASACPVRRTLERGIRFEPSSSSSSSS